MYTGTLKGVAWYRAGVCWSTERRKVTSQARRRSCRERPTASHNCNLEQSCCACYFFYNEHIYHPPTQIRTKARQMRHLFLYKLTSTNHFFRLHNALQKSVSSFSSWLCIFFYWHFMTQQTVLQYVLINKQSTN